MAGLYTLVDSTSGVWKAPANLSLNSVIGSICNPFLRRAGVLEYPPWMGKRSMPSAPLSEKGCWYGGARTLDGRQQTIGGYISVRRTVDGARTIDDDGPSKPTRFEPNQPANPWINVKSMLENYLTQQWKKWELWPGASPTDAFSVRVGLEETMTAEDILEW